MISEEVKGEGMIFSSPTEALMALDAGQVNLQAKVRIRVNTYDAEGNSLVEIVETSPGRAKLSTLLPNHSAVPFNKSLQIFLQ